MKGFGVQGSRFKVQGFVLSGLTLVLIFIMASCKKRDVSPPPSTPLTAECVLSTNTIHIGNLVTATLTVTHPENTQIQVPELGREKAVVLRERKEENETGRDRPAKTRITYTLTSYQMGSHLLSTGTIRCAYTDGVQYEEPYPNATLHVISVRPGDEITLKGIKEPIEWPKRFPRWLAVFLFIACLAGIIAFVVKRFFIKSTSKAAPEKPPVPAHEIALKALQDLLKKGWIEEKVIEPFYVKLSYIVRQYIENRFHLRAPEQTTEEFIRDAATSNLLSLEHQQRVEHFLHQSDLVKFAKHCPQPDDMRAVYSAAEQLVQETVPEETI
ncbi:MAG: hypothetical protein GKR87_00945 [Kiritimatiellae bacterium]|nr:hypothetical protein [Kiritimatiellia bacterium]